MSIKYGGNSPKHIYIRVNEVVHVTGVSLDQSSIILNNIGDTVQLTATVTPSNADDTSVTWSTSDATVAIVSTTGLVTCVTPGTCTITVTTTDGGYTATCGVANGRVPGANTLLYYSFDDQNLNDGSGNGNNGSWYGGTPGTYVTGIKSYGVDTSANRAITLPIPLPIGDMTFSICANVTQISGVLQAFFGIDSWHQAGMMAFSIDDTQGINFIAHTGGTTPSIVTNIMPTINTWFNTILTRSGNVWTIYYNGTNVGSSTIAQSPSQTITWYISRNYDNNRYIRGTIDEVILENRAWSAQEVADYVASLGL